MSTLNYTNKFEDKAKQISLNQVVSQFSGIFIIDYKSQIEGSITYLPADGAVSFLEPVLDSTLKTSINVINRIRRAWALPGYILTENIRNRDINPAISLPTLPFGYTLSEPSDILLVTAIPKYWYPEVPNGDKLNNYELSFSNPFYDFKNNRQLFKVKQHNILEEGILIIQLSSLSVETESSVSTTSFINDSIFGI